MRGTFAAPPFCKTFKSDPVASIMRVSIELNVNVCVWACAREKKKFYSPCRELGVTLHLDACAQFQAVRPCVTSLLRPSLQQ